MFVAGTMMAARNWDDLGHDSALARDHFGTFFGAADPVLEVDTQRPVSP